MAARLSRPSHQESEFTKARADRHTAWKSQPYEPTSDNYVGTEEHGLNKNWTHPIRKAGEIWRDPEGTRKKYSGLKEDDPQYNKITGEVERRVPVVPHQLDPGYGKALKDREFIDEKGYSRTHDSSINKAHIKKHMRDGVIKYWTDSDMYEDAYNRVSEATGIPVKRVKAKKKAEHINFLSDQKQHYEIPRSRDGRKLTPQEASTYNFSTNENFDINEDDSTSAIGISMSRGGKRNYGHDNDRGGARMQASQTNPFSPVNAGYGRKNLSDKDFTQSVVDHEVGHNFGLMGDTSLSGGSYSNDPSVMSYNKGKNSRLNERDFASIKEAFAPHMKNVTKKSMKGLNKNKKFRNKGDDVYKPGAGYGEVNMTEFLKDV